MAITDTEEKQSALANLTALQTLILGGNNVSDISALADLFQLRSIDLSFNDISDIDTLVDSPFLGPRDFVDLTENPLSPEAIEGVETLRGRGVGVAFGS